MPANTTDVQITTSSSGNLTDSGYNLFVESLNVTDSSPRTGYTIVNNSAATASTIQLGAGTTFTNNYSGKSNDLLFLQDTNLTITGLVSGKSTLGVVLTQSGNFDIAEGSSPVASTLAISAVISGAFGITMNGDGTGTANLSGANTYSGGTVVNAGTVNVNTGGTLGSSAGALAVNAATGFTTALNLNVSQTVSGLSGTIAGTGTATITIASGFTLNSTQSVNTEYDGILTGSGGLTKDGAGTLSLTNASSAYTGGTIINGGTLAVNGPNRVGSASGSLTINNGTFQLTTIGGVNPGISSGRNIVLGSTGSTIQIDAGPGYTATSAAVVSGTGTLNKTGGGSLTLSGANTYGGGTVVTAGTLLANNTTGSGTGSGTVTVNGGLLGGTGTIAGPATGTTPDAVNVGSNGTISAGATGGNSIGKLTVGNTTNAQTTPSLTLNGTMQTNITTPTGTTSITAGTNNDQISVLGALTLNSTSKLSVVTADDYGMVVGQVFYVALNDGTDPINGTFNGQIDGSTVTDNIGDTFTISYSANGDNGTMGNDISLTVSGLSVTPVPEPATVLGGCLLVGAAGWSQRRRLRGALNA